MSEPVRVLHVLGTLNMGGAESRIMELYRAIDKEQVQFDFLLHTKDECSYNEEVRKLGGKIYVLPRFKVINYFEYKKAIKSFFSEHQEFSAVHGHITSTAAIYLPIAKRIYKHNGRDLTCIAHARSAGVDKGIKGIVTRILRLPLSKKTDYCFTCSKEAGVSVFGKRAVKNDMVVTLPNAININRFKYNPATREIIREQEGWNNKYVIGHVGRLSFMKNHTFMIDILHEICAKRDDVILAFVGVGEEEENIRNKIKQLQLEDKVKFLGSKRDVENYYQAFDYFLFPSTFEGLPGTVVEAQAAGLKCLISDSITDEVVLSCLVKKKSLNETAKNWAEEILLSIEDNRRLDVLDLLKQKGFDVETQAEKYEEFYKTGKLR